MNILDNISKNILKDLIKNIKNRRNDITKNYFKTIILIMNQYKNKQFKAVH